MGLNPQGSILHDKNPSFESLIILVKIGIFAKK